MTSAATSRALPTRLGLIGDLADRLRGVRPSLIAPDEPSRGILHRLHPPHLKFPVRRSREAVHSPVDTAIEIGTGTDLDPLSVGSRQERLLRRRPHLRAPGFAQDLVLDHEHPTPVGEHLENVEGAAAEGNRLSIDQKFSPFWAAPLRSGASLRLPGATPHLAVLGGQRLHGRYFRWLGVEAS
jgi:hypothetical protein